MENDEINPELMLRRFPTQVFKIYKPRTRSGSSTIYNVIESGHKSKSYKSIEIGDTLGGRYKVLDVDHREICSIYICQDQKEQIRVVLKTLNDQFLYSEEFKNLFKEEALIAINLEDHPQIVKALHFKFFDGVPFLILEYIQPDEKGRNTLEQYLKEPLTNNLIIKWAIQFCKGMEYAGQNSILAHRDIKPENILITRDKDLKINDFGMAEVETETESYICGTPPWMAPEQFRGESDIRSDIYSFGIVLYQMVSSGELPFQGASGIDTEEEIENWYQVHKKQELPHLDHQLFPIVNKCLQKDPVNRYQNFKDLRNDLEKVESS